MSDRSHRGHTGSVWRKHRRDVLSRTRVCWLCGQITCPHCGQTQGADSIDLVTPYSRGGSTTDPRNMRAAHRCCNSRRGNDPPPTFTTETW